MPFFCSYNLVDIIFYVFLVKHHLDVRIITRFEGEIMINQFSRTQLLLGKENMDILKAKRVAIFGIGGVGGHVCDALARSGIENFVLIDHDFISLTNINRQLIANLNTVNQYKVDVMKNHILSINPNAKVEINKCFFLPQNQDQFDFNQYDYVIDAIDTVTAKIAIISKCKELSIPIISSMGTGNKLNPTMLEVSDIYKTSVCPLAKVMRHELKKRNIKNLKVVYSKEKPMNYHENEICEETTANRKNIPASTAFVPSVAGLIIASEVIKDFCNLK